MASSACNTADARIRGATAEAINAILTRYVPAERIDEDIHGQRPARRVDVEKKLAKARRDCRDFRLNFLICAMLVVAGYAWLTVKEDSLKAVVIMMVLTAGYIVPLFWMMRRTLQSRCQELEWQLSSFDEPAVVGGTP